MKFSVAKIFYANFSIKEASVSNNHVLKCELPLSSKWRCLSIEQTDELKDSHKCLIIKH